MTGDEPHRYQAEVEKRARRMRRARTARSSLWRHVMYVGALGWMLVLPVVLGALGGRALRAWVGLSFAPLIGIILGLCVGILLVWRELRGAVRDVPGDRP